MKKNYTHMTVPKWYRENKIMSPKDVIVRIPQNKLWSECNKNKFTIIDFNIFLIDYV